MEEYRHLNGWSKDKKKGSTRYNRVPVNIADEVCFHKKEDYLQFIPDSLNDGFTSKEYKSATRISLSNAQTGLNILNDIGAVTRVGKQGNLYVYERTASCLDPLSSQLPLNPKKRTF
jgi:Fic family protein